VVGLLKISSAIDWVNARFGVIANWLVLLSCLISAGNAVSRYLFSESSNGWLEVQWYMFAGMVLPAGRTPSPATSTSASTSSTARSRSARASGSTSSAVPWGCSRRGYDWNRALSSKCWHRSNIPRSAQLPVSAAAHNNQKPASSCAPSATAACLNGLIAPPDRRTRTMAAQT
jgi:hypothetical protein